MRTEESMMRKLTTEERGRLEQRQAGLDPFVREGLEFLVDFVNHLGVPEPAKVLRHAESYIQPVDLWLEDQVVAPEDRVWIIARIGYFIGEVLNQRLGGDWFVDTHPDSPYFAQYVVGEFTGLSDPSTRISPFGVAANYVDQPPRRSLSAVIERVVAQLRQ
jgi:hypothetical protein